MTNPFAIEARIRELADKAVTDFLSPLSEKRASPEYVRKHATDILADSGKDLTPIVAKIAKDDNLNPHETARVCEEANKAAFLELYKLSNDKTFEFPVADATEVLAILDRPYVGPGDIHLPVEHPKSASESRGSQKKTASSTANSWAATALRPTEGQKALMQMEEEKVVKMAFTEGLIESRAVQDGAAFTFMKMARDLVLEDAISPSMILNWVREARPGSPIHEKVAKDLLAIVALGTKTKFYEGAQEIVKIANIILETSDTGSTINKKDSDPYQYEFWAKSPGVKPGELIGPVSSSGDPVRIINNNHKIFLTLDSIVDQRGKEDWWGKGLLFSHDRVRTALRNVFNWTPKSEKVPG